MLKGAVHDLHDGLCFRPPPFMTPKRCGIRAAQGEI